MSQITIYLDDDTSQEVRGAAAAAGISVSRWIAELIRRRAAAEWPRDVAAMAGSWPDFPTSEVLRQAPNDDLGRESI